MANLSDITYCGRTDVGLVRKNNEDAFYAQAIWDNSAILAIVTDGLGGHEGGEVASRVALDTIVKFLNEYRNGVRTELLRQAVIEANNVIVDVQKQPGASPDMGTVITVLLIEPKQDLCYMAHVGDTRLYQLRNNVLTKLSHDHSLVGYQEEKGELTEIEAMNHPQRNVISRVLGSNTIHADSTDFVETRMFQLEPESSLLLCSDGLYDLITSTEIAGIVSSHESIEAKAQKLIENAKIAGGKDNITVVLIKNDTPIRSQIVVSKESIIDNEVNIANKYVCKGRFYIPLFCFIALLLGCLFGGFWGYKFIKNEGITHDTLIVFDTIYMRGANYDSLQGVVNEKDSVLIRIENEIKKGKLNIGN